jgi:hypothetical protein
LCQTCQEPHLETLPHKLTSQYYQDTFMKAHGRAPTWADAIAHCSEFTKSNWEKALREHDAWSEPEADVPVVMNLGGKQAVELTPLGESEAKSIRISELEACIDVLKTERAESEELLADARRRDADLNAKLDALRVDAAQSLLTIIYWKANNRAVFAACSLRIQELEAALQPYAAEGAKWHENFADDERPYCLLHSMIMGEETAATFTVGDLRHAGKVLKSQPPMEPEAATAELARLRRIEILAKDVLSHPHGSAEELDALATLNALLQKAAP